MYLMGNQALGESSPARACSGWERDLESFSTVVAKHYVRTELGQSLHPERIWCSPARTHCHVYFPGDITVMVSFVRVPDYVIARQTGQDKPRREYNYQCTPQGRLVLSPRK